MSDLTSEYARKSGSAIGTLKCMRARLAGMDAMVNYMLGHDLSVDQVLNLMQESIDDARDWLDSEIARLDEI